MNYGRTVAAAPQEAGSALLPSTISPNAICLTLQGTQRQPDYDRLF